MDASFLVALQIFIQKKYLFVVVVGWLFFCFVVGLVCFCGCFLLFVCFCASFFSSSGAAMKTTKRRDVVHIFATHAGIAYDGTDTKWQLSR